ncbi:MULTISPECIES: class I SAM-dependent methyltransferase [unclassified Streptomyces]|uniref:class I SAM-dependent methyltransferase n=1 Tax=unclassified Streptomyces TaxID=2593676 RepID=UPI0022516834|nr:MULTISPECIES: class I SAM-dependent methyltransferase [unclassified Streptomyces]MCX4885652.1 class I SAM-dependent methyltransferase [Streptomyces sp. NBC_00847]MCX5425514.1 class I SAM-dependent methyltransferase [Streptomyces sp. NBC_00078]
MATVQATDTNPGELKDVPGWFPPLDQTLFTWFLERQETRGFGGDLVELGAYMGKSAVLLGHHRQDGEEFTVCDLFGGEAPDGANRAETAKSYASLTRQAFERNYLAFHGNLPTVIEAPTSVISKEVAADSCRFVHIDASHLYEHVHDDIGAARDLLLPDGIVVLDDFRSEHTPGVSVATWEAVLNRGLRPICLSTQKLYGTWGDPEPVQEELLTMLRARTDVGLSVQEAAGHRLVRTRAHKGMQAPPFPRSRYYTGPEQPKSSTPAGHAPAATPRRPRSRARRIGVDLLPPIVTRAIRRALASGAQGAAGRAARRRSA